MSEAIEQRCSQPLVPQDVDPLGERQVGGEVRLEGCTT